MNSREKGKVGERGLARECSGLACDYARLTPLRGCCAVATWWKVRLNADAL